MQCVKCVSCLWQKQNKDSSKILLGREVCVAPEKDRVNSPSMIVMCLVPLRVIRTWQPKHLLKKHKKGKKISTLFPAVCLAAGAHDRWNPFALTVLEQALTNVMNLGLNCRALMGPECFPSSTATFIPLSVLQTWTRPSSEPERTTVLAGSSKEKAQT